MKHGFSLVELSIVLVILGLLTGGILGGQALMRAAELRSVTQEFNKYQIAANTFKDQYFALPGDMNNATQFWGAAHATPATCLTTTGTGTQTCDGNGDGIYQAAAAANQYGEHFTFWQHLANAGLIEGEYTGIAGPNADVEAILKGNVPSSKLGNSGWSVGTSLLSGGSTEVFAGISYGNFLLIGMPLTSEPTRGKILSSEDTWNIDTKVDDGRPAHGKLIARWWDDCTDAATNADLDSDYLLSTSGSQCALYFSKAF